MGSNPDVVVSTPKGQDEQVTWIGRDRAFERVEAPEPPFVLTSPAS